MAGVMEFAKTLMRKAGIMSAVPEHKHPELFSQYLISLEGMWLGLGKTDDDVSKDPTLTKIKGLLAAGRDPEVNWSSNWRNAWQAEQLMCNYLSPPRLTVEAERNLVEADKLELKSAAHLAAKWKASKEPNAPNPFETQQSVAATLLRDIHWRYSKKGLDRDIRGKMALTATRVAFVFFILAVLPHVPFFSDTIGTWLFGSQAHFYGLYTAATFGLLGALFSRLIFLQTNYAKLEYEDLINIFQKRALAIRLLLGMIGAVIVFYAILGTLLGGELFPDAGELKFDASQKPGKDFAKLVIWCFLGGFSERLVPDFLTRTESAAAAKTK